MHSICIIYGFLPWYVLSDMPIWGPGLTLRKLMGEAQNLRLLLNHNNNDNDDKECWWFDLFIEPLLFYLTSIQTFLRKCQTRFQSCIFVMNLGEVLLLQRSGGIIPKDSKNPTFCNVLTFFTLEGPIKEYFFAQFFKFLLFFAFFFNLLPLFARSGYIVLSLIWTPTT